MTSTRSFQTGITHRPSAVVTVTGADDVVAALARAGHDGLAVTVHATGHGLRRPCDGGLLIDTAPMAEVTVDPVARTARAGAGATWGDVVAAAAPHGLRPPHGSAPSVGVVGYLSGGGLGLAVRADGWAADHVHAVELARAGGTVRVSAASDPRYFARLRGTGPDDGDVVTAVVVGLLGSDGLVGGGLVRVLGDADTPGDPAALHAWADWTSALPDDVTSGLSVVPCPDLPFLPAHLRGRRILRVGVVGTGGPGRTDALLAPLRAAVAWDDDTVAPLDPRASARVYAEPEFPHAYLGDDVLVDGLDRDGLERVVSRTGPMVVTGIRHLGGRAGRAPAVADTVRGRDAAYCVNVLAPFGDDAVPTQVAWREVDHVLDGFAARATRERSHPAFRFGPHRGVPAS
ncbi:FAD-dependent oxidoreductase [Pseudonocardia sp. DR1-2]|uniref:FAD-binding protein n=1 Tax=Pseudonocardia sp. DR1-2 TaxID=2951168 RepID=UPI0020443358|nr:FAD-binding protein [Pseudonocardia sp. DR1-2]MCM3844929.1 FAD-dependent oxidoreductase [Pseudonocardia sp. DR1-2]